MSEKQSRINALRIQLSHHAVIPYRLREFLYLSAVFGNCLDFKAIRLRKLFDHRSKGMAIRALRLEKKKQTCLFGKVPYFLIPLLFFLFLHNFTMQGSAVIFGSRITTFKQRDLHPALLKQCRAIQNSLL